MKRVEWCPLERRRNDRWAHPYLRQSGRRSVRPLPPLSWTLRDSPDTPTLPSPRERGRVGWGTGLTPSVSGRSPAAFQSALAPAVLLPESFRGGCSFGAAPARDLSCGRAYSAFCLSSVGPGGQLVSRGKGSRGGPSRLVMSTRTGFPCSTRKNSKKRCFRPLAG